MPYMDKDSQRRLGECVPEIQLVCKYAFPFWMFRVICGFRGKEEQEQAYNSGASQVNWPNGKHNAHKVGENGEIIPASEAVDLMPIVNGKLIKCLPPKKNSVGVVDPEDAKRYQHELRIYYRFAGFMEACGFSSGVMLRWGGDWDYDWDIADQTFNDLYHFERLGISRLIV